MEDDEEGEEQAYDLHPPHALYQDCLQETAEEEREEDDNEGKNKPTMGQMAR